MHIVKQMLCSVDLLGDRITDNSIACISTNRPIYLIFNQQSNQPVYVVRKLQTTSSFYSYQITCQLYERVGKLVPEPIGVYEHAGEKYYVERGVKGSPWFQLRSKVSSKKARIRLENRIWQTLQEFQEGIYAKEKSEVIFLKPQEELLKALSLYQANGYIRNTGLENLVKHAVRDLSNLPNCNSIPQHGDFCINNLIIDKNNITVIDFEDFSITNMPLFDYFTLALSVPSRSSDPDKIARAFKLPVIAIAASTHGIPEEAIRWHFLHHLLLRLGPWSLGVKRAQYRAWLSKVLDSFIENESQNDNVKTKSQDTKTSHSNQGSDLFHR